MMISVALIAIELVTLHRVDGRIVQINPMQIQQMLHQTENPNKLVAPKAKCVIRMAGNYVSVTETCEEVQKLLEGNKP